MNFRAFLSFGLAGTVVGLIIRLLPIDVPYMDAGLPFFAGWWVAAAIGSMLFPSGDKRDSP